jgi:hypothetical protein
MATSEEDEQAKAGHAHPYVGALPVAGWSALLARPVVPLWMRAQLVRLQAAFPEFSFTIGPRWRGLTFEAWRDTGGAGLYAVITPDIAELWRELEKDQAGSRPVAGTYASEGR